MQNDSTAPDFTHRVVMITCLSFFEATQQALASVKKKPLKHCLHFHKLCFFISQTHSSIIAYVHRVLPFETKVIMINFMTTFTLDRSQHFSFSISYFDHFAHAVYQEKFLTVLTFFEHSSNTRCYHNNIIQCLLKHLACQKLQYFCCKMLLLEKTQIHHMIQKKHQIK